jgi:hypothetical protein
MGGPTIDSSMLWALLVMAVAFTMLFVTLLTVRMRSALMAAKIRALRLSEIDDDERRVGPSAARTPTEASADLLS